MMKGKQTLTVLRYIAGYTGLMLGDIAMAFLDPHHQGLLANGYRLSIEEGSLRTVFKHKQASKEKRRTFSQIIYRLKQDGLIDEQENKFVLTPHGYEKLKKLEHRCALALPDPYYTKKLADEFKIVSFDIPESQARKRAWLRSVLCNLDYKMLQKSVWIGKAKIPQSLIEDFKKLHLFRYIEIFAITKTGSLREII